MPSKPLVTPRRLAAIGAAAILTWLSVSVGGASVLRAANPAWALKFSSNDSRALSNLADGLLKEDQSPAAIKKAGELGRRALAGDATNAVALRLVGASAPAAKQFGIHALAERVSKRDLATQLWLIEDAVSQDKVDQALVHYDIALRTSTAASPALFPILAQATGDQRLLPQITAMLKRKPDWTTPFLYEAVNSAPDAGALVGIFGSLQSSGYKVEPDLSINLLKRTVRDNRFDLATSAYRLAGGTNAGIGSAVTDGGFTALGTLQPFDWALSSDNGLFSDRGASSDSKGGARLEITAEAGAVGDAAKQLLLLKPGKYRLTALVGNIPQQDVARFFWAVGCAGTEDVISLINLPPTPASKTTMAGEFTVPANGCGAQWLSLAVRAEVSSDGADDPWVTDVAVARVN
jgi:hypothetical protein